MEGNPEIATALTRVVLTEKAPFWVDVFSGSKEEYHGTFLVRNCVSREDFSKNWDTSQFNIFDCYIISEGRGKGLLAHKTDCRRARK